MDEHAADGSDGIARVAEVVTRFGAHSRGVRAVVAALTERPMSLGAIVRQTAIERRTVEEILAALGPDAEHTGASFAIRPDRRTAYRERFAPAPELPLDAAALTVQLRALIDGAPAPSKALDHVTATAETAAWRALWLAASYELTGARLLCVGDHDLTSLAVALVNPQVAVTVVDLDERILAYIDARARELGLDVRCLFGDLRLGLPAAAVASADIVFTDPPYTPAGVKLFLARGAEGLRDREHGRLAMAYGYSDRAPALGLKVQQAAQELALVFEAILPKVNRYRGAEAIGSASDLYVCRPTTRTWKLLRSAAQGAATIYTHGPQSEEAAADGPDAAVLEAVLERLGAPATVLVGPGWGSRGGLTRLGLDRLLAGGLPGAATVRGATAAAVDLATDRGPLLLRVLLAANADRLAVLVPNDHPDLASEAGQRELAELVAGKYRLKPLRSTPGPAWAVLVAERAAEAGLAGRVLDRAHGKLGNVWRDGLVAALGYTKNEARAAVRLATERADCLDRALLELPRHLVRLMLEDVARSAPPA